jgi:hypothetical protein
MWVGTRGEGRETSLEPCIHDATAVLSTTITPVIARFHIIKSGVGGERLRHAQAMILMLFLVYALRNLEDNGLRDYLRVKGWIAICIPRFRKQ